MESRPSFANNALTPSQRLRERLYLPEPLDQLPSPLEAEAPEQVLSLGHYIWLLRRHVWKIAIAVTVCTTLAGVAAYTMTPIFESTARIAIDMKTPASVLGEPTMAGSASDAEQVFNTELQLIQSDAVLRPVAERFHLVSNKAPKKMPAGMTPSDASISLSKLGVVHPPNTFLIDISYRSPDPRLAADVANAVAHSYISHGMETRAHSSIEQTAFMEKQIAELKKNMDNSAIALEAYQRRLGIINPDEKTSMLASRLLQLNTQYTDAANDRIRKEASYRALESGSQSAAIEVSTQAADLAKLTDAMHVAQQKMETMKAIYGPNYIEYKRAANELAEATREYNDTKTSIAKRMQVDYEEAKNREAMLHSELMKAKSESDAVNSNTLDYQQLKNEAEANKTLYNELFRKVKEAGMNGSFQGSASRIADEARPQLHPVFPNKMIFIFLGFLFSSVVSLIVVIISDMFDKSLRDPDQARRALGTEIIGVLPHVHSFGPITSRAELALVSSLPFRKSQTDWFNSTDFYDESIDTLLTSILIDPREKPLHSILVTSAAPGEGKSSCVAHMAAAFARHGHRTLLIDADLRRPSQQRHFGLDRRKKGLSDAIATKEPLSAIRQSVDGHDNLHIVTAGSSDPQLYNQVGKKVEEILRFARRDYEMIFIDAPPMLCFAETIQLACAADGVLVVSHAGQTNQRDVQGVLATLRRLRACTLGVVLNRVHHNMSSNYGSYKAYRGYLEGTVENVA